AAGAIRVIAQRGRLRATPADVLFRMGLRVVAVLGAAVRRDVPFECPLACWSQDRELHAEAAVAAIAASSATAETVAVRRPDTGKVARLEGHVRIEKLGIAGSGGPATTRRCGGGALSRPCPTASVLRESRHNHPDGYH